MGRLQRLGRSVAWVSCAVLAGCGGGGGGGDPGGGGPTFGTLTIRPAAPADDGYFRSDGAHVPTSANKIAVGANGTDYVAGYVRFQHDLTLVAEEGRLTSVFLSLSSRGGVQGVAEEHRQIYVHHTDFGAVIDGNDYGNSGAFIPDGVIQWGHGSPSPFVLDVTDEVLADILDGYTDIYLQPTGVPTDGSYWSIEDVDDPADVDGAPQLIVEFEE